jgi:hypothetical protein
VTQKPWLSAALLCLGAVAVVYNIRAYGELLSGPAREAPESSLHASAGARDEVGTHGGDETEGSEEVYAEPVAPLSAAALAAFLATLPPEERDPFVFAEARADDDSDLAPGAAALPIVQGILLGEGRRVAWIANRAVVAGDEVAGYIVVSIDPDAVTVMRAGTEHRLVPAATTIGTTIETP